MHVVGNPRVENGYGSGPVKVIMAGGVLLGEPVTLAPPPVESKPPATIPADRPKVYRNGVQERMARKRWKDRTATTYLAYLCFGVGFLCGMTGPDHGFLPTKIRITVESPFSTDTGLMFPGFFGEIPVESSMSSMPAERGNVGTLSIGRAVKASGVSVESTDIVMPVVTVSATTSSLPKIVRCGLVCRGFSIP